MCNFICKEIVIQLITFKNPGNGNGNLNQGLSK